MDIRDRFRGCLLGLAVGDAVGTALEFKEPGSFKPIRDMVGGGPFRLRPGEWTDDTSMALCLATSLVEKNGFDPKDQMDRYCRWWKEGYLSSNGRCFDIGNTVAAALRRYMQTGDPLAGLTSPYSAGNGSIMRLAPVPLFYYPDVGAATHYAAESSRTTHAAPECIDACRLLAGVICCALAGTRKEDVLFGGEGSWIGEPTIAIIARGTYRDKSIAEIRGTGYVIESLEAALWCFLRTDTFEAAILKAANLGDDADTTAAVCGQVAGAYYGESGIPKKWLKKLVMREAISILAERLLVAVGGGKGEINE
ncbi:MAG TPA: ADP-ribosylglycohydrolase family protein [candidate division Zixibacteria bacterium]|nr:ADP-ribosylglycohydrolase family protein [candidate division Zixibacteria bacterium]